MTIDRIIGPELIKLSSKVEDGYYLLVGGKKMIKKGKLFVTLLLTGTMLISVTACSQSGASDSGQADDSVSAASDSEQNEDAQTAAVDTDQIKEQLDIALTSQPSSFDLHKITSSEPIRLMCGTVYEQLLTLNSESEPVPELCESYEVSEDGTEYTFVLRQNVNFHNGDVMDADDVVASLNRWVENYSAVKDLIGESRFEKVDDSTVKITLDGPCATLPYMLAAGSQRAVITTAEACENEGEDGYMTEIIGTGPYMLTETVTDQYTMLERFEDYSPYGDPDEPCDGWAGYKHAYTPAICAWVVGEEATRVAGLQTGQYDSANVSDAMLTTLESYEDITLEYEEEGGQVAIVFNKQSGLCSDVNMRKAINAIVNPEELMMVSYGNSYTLNASYMESTQPLWYSDAGSEYYGTMDTEAAAQYLEAAGYNGETLQILASSDNNFDKIGGVLEQELEAAGIDCEMTTVDWGTFTEYRTDPDRYDLFISSYSTTPVPSLRSYFSEDTPGWTSDSGLDDLWAVYNNSLTLDEAAVAWVDIQQYCWEEYLPVISLGHYVSHDVMNSHLEGVIYFNGGYYWNAYVPQ